MSVYPCLSLLLDALLLSKILSVANKDIKAARVEAKDAEEEKGEVFSR